MLAKLESAVVLLEKTPAARSHMAARDAIVDALGGLSLDQLDAGQRRKVQKIAERCRRVNAFLAEKIDDMLMGRKRR